MNLKPILKLAAHSQATAILVAVTVASAGFAGWLHEHDQRVTEAATFSLRLAAADNAIAHAEQAQARAETVTVHDSVRVVHATTRLDTLWQAIPDTIRTTADTVRVLNALPTIRQQSDSTVRACRDQVVSCATFRVSAKVLEDSLRAKIDTLSRHVAAEKPSRFACVAGPSAGVVRVSGAWRGAGGGAVTCGFRF